MKEGALRRSGLGPSLQGGQLLERRQVVAVARGHQSTAHALGGFMISCPLPEISHLLLEASSHAGTSGGRNAISFL